MYGQGGGSKETDEDVGFGAAAAQLSQRCERMLIDNSNRRMITKNGLASSEPVRLRPRPTRPRTRPRRRRIDQSKGGHRECRCGRLPAPYQILACYINGGPVGPAV
jgi:hypothetical protein